MDLLKAGLLLLASTLLVACAESQTTRVERVLLISIDTLRPDFLGCYDAGKQTTPNLDRLAEEAWVFDDAISSAPSTTISHKSLFYSLHPAIHKTRRDRVPREEAITSPIEELRRNGLTTAAFVGGGGLAPELGFSRGFDSYEVLPRLRSGLQLETLETQSLRWLESHGSENFFLFLHTYQPHCPYSPPAEFAERFAGWYGGDLDPTDLCGVDFKQEEMSDDDYRYVRDLYAAEVAYVDRFVGRLFDAMKRLEIYEDTMIVFTSDHGDSLGERGLIGHNQTFDRQLRVPLIIKTPGVSPGRVGGPAASIDVMPTVFAGLGFEPPYRFTGLDLLPVMLGEERIDPRRVRVANQGDAISVHRGRWHLRWDPTGVPAELYDVLEDPEELTDLSEGRPEIVEELGLEYAREIAANRDLAERFVLRDESEPDLTPETLDRLKALGYLR